MIGYSASAQKDWKKRLERAIRNQKLGVKDAEFFCFICTNATYASAYVQEQMNKIKGDCLFVVDEAHNFGAENLSRLLNENFRYRLALSATLERHHDEEGTQKLYDYFGEKCIEYTLERAIDEGKLTRYKYYPVIVELTVDEQKEYYHLTKEIIKCLKRDKHGKIVLSERGKKLCLKRARLDPPPVK
ncbi:MAG: DEAD/DEAH box helicase family protein [Oscillospiraceae bacterium]|nr:DEAD/DEAH box helicase family protein [Oscillospiraceae bacterium]